jgi:acylphosphatase
MKHLTLSVRGLVQGVCFRDRTLEKAKDLGLKGFVCNEPDGSVRIEVEGGESHLQSLVEWAHQGPNEARVDQVVVEEGECLGYTDFIIES